MKAAGWDDWLFIDLEHNSMDMDMACQISVAAQDAGITPVVPHHLGFEHHLATRALDGGALGIVVPHVDDVETAAQMASNTLSAHWPSLNDGYAAAGQFRPPSHWRDGGGGKRGHAPGLDDRDATRSRKRRRHRSRGGGSTFY